MGTTLGKEFINLLEKDNLTEEEMVEIFYHTIRHLESEETDVYRTVFDVVDFNTIYATETGFILERSGEFRHLITINVKKFKKLSKLEIIKLATLEYGKIIEANKLAKKLDFKIDKDRKKYIDSKIKTEEEIEELNKIIDEYSNNKYSKFISLLKEVIKNEELLNELSKIDEEVVSVVIPNTLKKTLHV